MAKYLVKVGFRDVHTKDVYSAGQEIEMTVKRAKEATENTVISAKKLNAEGRLSDDKLIEYENGILERVDR